VVYGTVLIPGTSMSDTLLGFSFGLAALSCNAVHPIPEVYTTSGPQVFCSNRSSIFREY